MQGCNAKLQRSAETLDCLSGDVGSFLASSAPVFTKTHEFRNNGKQYAFIARGKLDVPPRFAVLAGEVIHHLRSSLDHLICALVVQNGGEPTQRNQFPICSAERFFVDALRRGFLDGLSNNAKNTVRSVQPFVTAAPDDTVLHVVQEFDNKDKHQLLIVLSTVMAIGDQIEVNPKKPGIGISGMSPPGAHQISDEGVVVFSLDFVDPVAEEDFEADAKLVPDLAFESCGRVKFAPIVSTLRGLMQGVIHTIGLFDREFLSPPPSCAMRSKNANR
jgi:hypothetical protein